MNDQANNGFKAYEELEFRDDFMFGHVMQDNELCHDVLECLLQRPVGELSEIVSEKELQFTSDGKPIRMDIYTSDSDEVYDAEVQNLNKKTIESLQLPKRTRFYQSSIDGDHLKKNYSYKLLPESTVLFICTFDPFNMGLPVYTFKEICEEENSLYLGDGTAKVFFNCTYRGDKIPEDLGKLFEYVDTGKCGSSLTNRLDEAVIRARNMEMWRSEYMKEMVLIMDAIEEERENTEAERKRADEAEARAGKAEARANEAEARVRELEAKLAALS